VTRQILPLILFGILPNAVDDNIRFVGQPQDDYHALPLFRDALHGIAQRPAAIVPLTAEQIAEHVLHVHPHQRRGIGIQIPLHQHQMQLVVDDVAIGMQLELAKLGGHLRAGHPLDGLFVEHAVFDEIGDGADLDAVLGGKLLQIGAAGHGAVLVEDLHDHRRRLEAGQARQITAGLGMPGTGQHAAGLGHQRKDVARLHQIGGPGIGRHGRLHGAGAIGGGNPGGHALRRLDGNGEVGGMSLVVLAHHERQMQPLATLLGQRQADEATAIARP